jgi:hypothetical protein
MNVIMLNAIVLSVIMLSVIMLSVIILNVIMLNVVMVSVIMLNAVMMSVIGLNVVMMSVVAPFEPLNLFLLTSIKFFCSLQAKSNYTGGWALTVGFDFEARISPNEISE